MTKATWQMNEAELARVVADHYGWTRRGNWIIDHTGAPVACGWQHLGQRLTARGVIRAGAGVNWTALRGRAPRLGRTTRTSAGYWN